MASLPALITYLDQLVTSAHEQDLTLPVSDALLATLDALNTPSSSRPQPLRPVQLATALADSSPTRRRLLATSEQQDAHELWGMIRDAVEDEARRLLAAQERAATRGTGLAEAATLRAGLGVALGKRRSRKAQTDPWFWLQSQRVKCMECGYVRDTRHEESELLMLQVPLVVSHFRTTFQFGKSRPADDLPEPSRRTARCTTSSPSTPRPTSSRVSTAGVARCCRRSPDSKDSATDSPSSLLPLPLPRPRHLQPPRTPLSFLLTRTRTARAKR